MIAHLQASLDRLEQRQQSAPRFDGHEELPSEGNDAFEACSDESWGGYRQTGRTASTSGGLGAHSFLRGPPEMRTESFEQQLYRDRPRTH